MMRSAFVSRPWLASCAVLMVPLARETSSWLIPPAWSSARTTCSRGLDIQRGGPPRPAALAGRVRARPALRNVALSANGDNSEAAGGEGNAADGSGGGAGKAGSAAPAPPQHINTKGKQQRVKAAEDSDAPIFYIKGLKEGGGVGVWGDNGNSNSDGSPGGDISQGARGGGNAAMMARALRNAEREIEGGGNYEEGVEDEGEVEEPADTTPVWEKVQAALGLGVWSYVGLGLAVFIIALNNVLGVGWAAKLIDPDYEPDSVLDVQQQGRQIQYMPLDDTSNLLSD